MKNLANKINHLPIINNHFFPNFIKFNNNEIKNLIGKYICFKMKDNTSEILGAKIYSFRNNQLFMCIHYIFLLDSKLSVWNKKEIKEVYGQYVSIEKIDSYAIIDNFTKECWELYDESLENQICEITNLNNIKIKALIYSCDCLSIRMFYKIKENCVENITYPLYLLKKIKLN